MYECIMEGVERYVDILKLIQILMLSSGLKFIYSTVYTSEMSNTRYVYNIQRKYFLLFL